MDELVQRVIAAAGLEPETARKAVGLILNFLLKDGPSRQVNAVIETIPGAREAMSGAAAEEDGTSVLSGFGGQTGGLMGLAGELGGLGLSMGEMQTVGRELLGFAREKVGEDTVGEIAAAIPGLHQLM